MSSVWLATHGSGEDGDEWGVEEIFFTEEAAGAYANRKGRQNWDNPNVCEWEVLGSFLSEEERESIDIAFNIMIRRHPSLTHYALVLKRLLKRTEAKVIDTADVVFHAPTGEKWVVAFVEGDRIYWVGYPDGCAELTDCTLVTKATEEQRQKLLEMMASSNGNGVRQRYARSRLLQKVNDA